MQQVNTFRKTARKQGYILHAQAAKGNPKSRSCGVLVAWRKHLAVQPDAGLPQSDRVVSVAINTKATGKIIVTSIYLPPKTTLAPGTLGHEIIQEVLSTASDKGIRTILGGDFNISPKLMAKWLTDNGHPHKVLCQHRNTYVAANGASNIDYFVVSPELAAIMTEPQIMHLSCIKKHKPVRTGWDTSCLNRTVTV